MAYTLSFDLNLFTVLSARFNFNFFITAKSFYFNFCAQNSFRKSDKLSSSNIISFSGEIIIRLDINFNNKITRLTSIFTIITLLWHSHILTTINTLRNLNFFVSFNSSNTSTSASSARIFYTIT